MVVAQVAMAAVLLVSALLMIRTFQALRNVEPGFADARASSDAAYLDSGFLWLRTRRRSRTLRTTLQTSLRRFRASASVGFAAALPMEGIDPNWDQIRVEGKNYDREDPTASAYSTTSRQGIFMLPARRMVAGREFTWTMSTA